MATRRAARVGQAILETVSTCILFELRDPRIKNVTVLRVEAAPDLRSAKVVVSVMGDEQTQSLTLYGLDSADRLQTRYTPLLSFELDTAATTNVAETNRILAELEAERQGSSPLDPAPETGETSTEAEDSES